MADSSQARRGTITWGLEPRRSIASLVAVVLLGALSPAGPPPMPMLVPERTRTAWVRALRLGVARRTAKARRRGRLLSARPAIGTAPTSRTANPVLPTVGRPRDGPRVRFC